MRRILPISLAAAGLVLAGCGKPPPPEVTFFSAGESLAAHPTMYCTDKCREYPAAREDLRVPAGQPLQISVAGQVADAPWVVVFKYSEQDGKQGPPSRTKIFPPGTQHAYTLRPPGGADQLTEVQVHRISGLGIGRQPGGELQFVSDVSWELRTG